MSTIPRTNAEPKANAVTRGALTDKVAIVTGGNRGIGRAIVDAFARAGASVVLVSRDRAAGETAAAGLTRQGLKVEVSVADVTDQATIAALVLEVTQRHPKIDILVNNAGVLLDEDADGRASTLARGVLERTLAVNLYGPIAMCVALSPHFRNGGRIINISSGAGQLEGESSGWAPAYSISKTALNAYTQSLAADLRSRHIMVDSMDPGWVKTDMGGPNARRTPQEAAETALFLAARPATEETGLFWHDKKRIPW